MPPLAIVLVGLVASPGCQSIDEPTAAKEIGGPAATTSATDYPSLHTVPPRPQLSYTVQQQRAIVDGLIADRANARYTDQVVRYRTGRSALPPPPTPPPQVAAAAPEAPAGPTGSPPQGPAASSYPDGSDNARTPGYPDDAGDDTLGGFVDELARDTAAPPAAGSADEGASAGGSGWFGWLRDLFGQADRPAPPAASPAVGPRAAAPVSSLDASAPAQASAPAEAETALALLVAETGAASAADRTRAPAAALQPAMAPGRAGHPPRAAAAGPPGSTLAASESGAPVPPIGIAIGDGEVAIEVAAPAAARPAPAASISAGAPAASRSAVRTAAVNPAASGTSAGRIAFAPGSAELPAGIGRRLEQVLASARTEGARIRIVGEAQAPALALDRARAVAIALVRLGARAGDLEMTLAPEATGDQAQLLLAPPAAR